MMNNKLRKLIKNPNRFFFDYFAKRIGKDVNLNAPKISKVEINKSEYLIPPGFVFDEGVHPWVQVAEKFKLRSGAISGCPDQSLLVDSVILLDFLTYVCWISYGFGSVVRLYSLGGGSEFEISKEKLLSINFISSIYKELRKKPDFVVELIGEFENNFAAHIFLYDTDPQEGFIVRSNRSFLKKSLSESFYETYPSFINEFGDYSFGTPWPVDIVYTWVNKDDAKWQEKWNESFPDQKINNDRFSSKDELKFSLRALCKYLPWYRKIFIVSNCEKPSWLKDNNRVVWVDHSEIYPDKEVLPIFNSHSIESVLHNIPGLSENFIYFNDDVFVNQPCYFNDFFDEIGRSISYLEPYGMVSENSIYESRKDYLLPAVCSQKLVKKEYPGYLAVRLHKHTPHVLKKSILQEMEGKFSLEFNRTRVSKIRSSDDINITSFLYHHYSLASGRAVHGDANYLIVRPRNINNLTEKNIRTYKFLCFNDGDGSADDDGYIKNFNSLMAKLYPKLGDFEKQQTAWKKIRISKTIMAYKNRAHRIPYLRKMLGNVSVSLDDGSLGIYKNSRQSWLSSEKNSDFHLVIQDDALVCENFYKRVHEVLDKAGEDRFKYAYCFYFRLKNPKKPVFMDFNKKAVEGLSRGLFFDKYLRYGIALMIPSSKVLEMIEHSDSLDDLGKHDDSRYSNFLSKNNIPIVYTLPSLIDQAPELDSTHSSRSNEGLRATWYVDGENKFPLERVMNLITPAVDSVDGQTQAVPDGRDG